jgi:hypothetical protein
MEPWEDEKNVFLDAFCRGRGNDITDLESRDFCSNGRARERGFSRYLAAAAGRTAAQR